MVTIIGIVAFIIVMVAFATSAILGQLLQDNLDAKLETTRQEIGQTLVRLQFPPSTDEPTAADVLGEGWQQPGTILLMQSLSTGATTGAYVDEPGDVEELTSEQISELIDAVTQPGTTSVSISGLGEYRVSALQTQRHVAIVGVSLDEVQATVAQIITTVAMVTAGGLLLLGIVIAIVIRRGLRPLRTVADTAARVAAMPLDQGTVVIAERVPDEETDEHTEIGRVGHALNTLLDHVGTSLDARQRNEERMRRFVADASHELRTPLASIRGYSELSLRDPSLSENTESSLERIQAQSLRMTTLVEDLLLLARLDEGQELVYGSVDLSRMVVDAVRDAQAAGPDHSWVLDLAESPVVVAGDVGRLSQVLAQPARQRPRAHSPGHHRHRERRRGARPGCRARARRRAGRRSGGRRRALRAVRPRRSLPRTQDRRHGPGPVDREGDHRCARRHDLGAEHSRRHHLHGGGAGQYPLNASVVIERARSRAGASSAMSPGGPEM
jgi:two-component system OmpR family sensor kinase